MLEHKSEFDVCFLSALVQSLVLTNGILYSYSDSCYLIRILIIIYSDLSIYSLILIVILLS